MVNNQEAEKEGRNILLLGVRNNPISNGILPQPKTHTRIEKVNFLKDRNLVIIMLYPG